MNSKKIMILVLLLLLLAAPVLAHAGGRVTVEISFTVVNAPSNVVMDAASGAPAPAQARFENTTGDTFRIDFAAPGEYSYKIYQDSGPDPALEYDGVVYDVLITVYARDDGTLDALVEAWIPGNSYKAMEIVFENPPGVRIDKDQRLNSGARTKKTVWGDPGDTITYFITVTNGSNNPVYDVEVTDAIPEGLMLVEGTISDGGSEENGVIKWTLGDIAATRSKTVQFSTIVPDVDVSTTWTNVAEGSYLNAPAALGRADRFPLKTNEVAAIYEPGPSATNPTPGETTLAPETTPTSTNTPETTENSDDTNPPQTGDDTQLKLWLVLMAISLIGIMGVLIASAHQGKRHK